MGEMSFVFVFFFVFLGLDFFGLTILGVVCAVRCGAGGGFDLDV